MKFLFLILMTALALQGCGPEMTQKEKEDAKLAQDAQEDAAACQPFEGMYDGTLYGYFGPQKLVVHLKPTWAPNERNIMTRTIAANVFFTSKDSSGTLVMYPVQLPLGFSNCDLASKTITIRNSANNANDQMTLKISSTSLSGTLITKNSGSRKVELRRTEGAFREETECAPFVGKYSGVFKPTDGSEQRMELLLFPSVVYSPTMSGTVAKTSLMNGSLNLATTTSGGTVMKSVLNFDFASCEAGHVTLYDQSASTIPAVLDLKWEKNIVTGDLKTTRFPNPGKVELKKESK